MNKLILSCFHETRTDNISTNNKFFWPFPDSAYSSHREDSVVSCIIHWKLGETKTYSIIHEKKSINPPGKNPPFRFNYEASVSVIDSSAKNYTIKWIFHLPEEMSILRPRLADSLPVYNGMQMIFRITEIGEFVELLNWEEVRDAYTRMMELSMPKRMDSTATAALKSAKNMYNSKEMVESSMIQEIRLFHRPYGLNPLREAPGIFPAVHHRNRFKDGNWQSL